MEVGPLARVLMLYAQGTRADAAPGQQHAVATRPAARALFSTLGRTAARTLETAILADAMQSWLDELIGEHRGRRHQDLRRNPVGAASWPKRCQGVGVMEAPRGALSHWIVIENEKIANYQAIVPSTWNAGPRDPGQPGAYEAALEDTHVMHDPEQPLEILRTIHSFDPCIACAVRHCRKARRTRTGRRR